MEKWFNPIKASCVLIGLVILVIGLCMDNSLTFYGIGLMLLQEVIPPNYEWDMSEKEENNNA